MPGLVPGIHVLGVFVDGRVKPGHDEWGGGQLLSVIPGDRTIQ